MLINYLPQTVGRITLGLYRYSYVWDVSVAGLALMSKDHSLKCLLKVIIEQEELCFLWASFYK